MHSTDMRLDILISIYNVPPNGISITCCVTKDLELMCLFYIYYSDNV